MNIEPFVGNAKCDRLDPAFRMVNTLLPIYLAIAIDTTYANNPPPNTRQMGGVLVAAPIVCGRLYLAAAKLLLPLPSRRAIWSW